jgi:uncharacterized protein YqeY
VSTIRLARAAIHNASIEAYAKGGRHDLAHNESLELAILSEYLPPPLSEAEIRALVHEAVVQTGATGPADLGRVMGVVMPKVKSRADGSTVQRLVRDVLGVSS